MYPATPPHGPLSAPADFQATDDAEAIFARVRRSAFRASAGPRDLLERALSYATTAQQTIAKQRARIAELEALSVTDELTGLLNRRGFTDALNRTLGNAHRHNEEGLLVAMDLDHFKPVNDAHGHAAGDAVLRHVAEFLSERVRTTDYLARMGGDEFALLMVNCELAPAYLRAHQLRSEINTASAKINCQLIPLRVSFGIAAYNGKACADQVLQMADIAMYHDKRRRAGVPEKMRVF